jgi:ATP-dependent RNA helicase DeaD
MVHLFANSVGVKTISLVGGEATLRSQIQACQTKHPQIIFGTPDRLLDLAHKAPINLTAVTVAVLDEANDMLNHGFIA